MSARARAREAQLAEANEREDMSLPGSHLHGTAAACPCGAETGITCVAFEPGWVQPDPCETCGKPVAAFYDRRPVREVAKHFTGCPEHPEAPRCTRCGHVPFVGVMFTEGGLTCLPPCG